MFTARDERRQPLSRHSVVNPITTRTTSDALVLGTEAREPRTAPISREFKGMISEPLAIHCESFILQPFSFNPLEFRGSYSATSNNMKLVHWPLIGGLQGRFYVGAWGHSPPNVGQAPQIFWF